MAKTHQPKDNQHYVPRFYLKNFAVAGTQQRAISMFRIAADRRLPIVSIEKQASSYRFYCSDHIEDWLGTVEGHAGWVIRRAIEQGFAPPWRSKEHLYLMMFVFYQAFRTKAAATTLGEISEQLVREFETSYPELTKLVGCAANEHANAPANAVQKISDYMPIVLDLNYKLLRNRTDVPFITSDNPAVMYNQFLEQKKALGSITGLGSKGLQVFLPINSWHMFVVFDANVYKVGKHRHQVLEENVVVRDDVRALNVLQVANADDCLFFDGGVVSEDLVRKTLARGKQFRRTNLRQLHAFDKPPTWTGGRGSVFITHRTDIKTRLKLSCVRINTGAQKYDPRGKAEHLRATPALEALKDYQRERDKQPGRAFGFIEFLREKRPELFGQHGHADL